MIPQENKAYHEGETDLLRETSSTHTEENVFKISCQ